MASPNVSFAQLPSSIRKPGKYFEFNTSLAVRTLPGNLQRVLYIGQRMAGGTIPAGQIVDIFSDVDAGTYFGRGSVLHLMCRAGLKTNEYMSLQAIALDDANASIAASGTVTITGPATGSGLLTLLVGSTSVSIVVSSGDTANTIAANLQAQIAAQPDLPLTAAVANAVVTLTAKNKGTLGNGIKIGYGVLPAGVSVAMVGMAGGAGDPTISTALPVVFAAGHNIIASAWNDTVNLAALRQHLDNVSSPLEQRGCIGTYGKVDTLSAATTLAGTVNGGRVTDALVPNAYENAYEVAASYAALIASEEDPARPLNGLPLTAISAPPQANQLGRKEIENALYNGVTPTEVDSAGIVRIVRAITTYTVDPTGVPDVSLLDLTTIRTLDYVRKAIRERMALRFPREKLSQRTPDKVRSETLDVLYKLEELEIVENVAANAPGVIAERDLQDDNRINLRIPVDVVNGLHVMAGRIDLLL